MASGLNQAVESEGLATFGIIQDGDAPVGVQGVNDGAGVVIAHAVRNQDFYFVSGVVLCQDSRKTFTNVMLFVVNGHDDAHGWKGSDCVVHCPPKRRMIPMVFNTIFKSNKKLTLRM